MLLRFAVKADGTKEPVLGKRRLDFLLPPILSEKSSWMPVPLLPGAWGFPNLSFPVSQQCLLPCPSRGSWDWVGCGESQDQISCAPGGLQVVAAWAPRWRHHMHLAGALTWHTSYPHPIQVPSPPWHEGCGPWGVAVHHGLEQATRRRD